MVNLYPDVNGIIQIIHWRLQIFTNTRLDYQTKTEYLAIGYIIYLTARPKNIARGGGQHTPATTAISHPTFSFRKIQWCQWCYYSTTVAKVLISLHFGIYITQKRV
jgi:hypothetical protein